MPISARLQHVIERELHLDQVDLDDSSTADEVPGWDSLAHANVLAAVEDAYGIRFRTLEVVRLRNIGELQQLIDRKLEAQAR